MEGLTIWRKWKSSVDVFEQQACWLYKSPNWSGGDRHCGLYFECMCFATLLHFNFPKSQQNKHFAYFRLYRHSPAPKNPQFQGSFSFWMEKISPKREINPNKKIWGILYRRKVTKPILSSWAHFLAEIKCRDRACPPHTRPFEATRWKRRC